jgi:hypothetical protein
MEQQIDKLLEKHAEQQTNLSSQKGRDLLVKEILEILDRENDTDFCVSCGIDTGVHKETHIDHRPFYIEGAGQMCKTCYDNIY